MRLFCTAVRMSVALGARAHAKHIERRKEAEARGDVSPRFINVIVIQRVTAVGAVGLVAG